MCDRAELEGLDSERMWGSLTGGLRWRREGGAERMWGSLEEAMVGDGGEKAGGGGGGGVYGEGMTRGGGGGGMVVEVEREDGVRRRTAGVWSETERGSPAAKR